MMRLIVAAVLLVAASGWAKSREFCGKRDGTAGNAYLVDKKNNVVITLAVQGESAELLEQADALIGKSSGVKGETGTQNGVQYCVTAELDDAGEPVKIVKARLKK